MTPRQLQVLRNGDGLESAVGEDGAAKALAQTLARKTRPATLSAPHHRTQSDNRHFYLFDNLWVTLARKD